MSARGVHFALDTEQYACVLEATDDVQLMALIEAIEQAWDRDFLAESASQVGALSEKPLSASLLPEENHATNQFPLLPAGAPR